MLKDIKQYILESVNIVNLKLAGKLTLVIGPVIALLEPIQHLIQPLLILAVIDVITGVIKSRLFLNEPISSKKFFDRKPLLILLWTLGLITMLHCDVFLSEIGINGHWAAKLYCVFYGLYEVISILENLAIMGLPGSKQIIKILKGRLPEHLQDIKERNNDQSK